MASISNLLLMEVCMRYVSYFRHPLTKNEMKQFYASKENELEISIQLRGRRKPKSLPNAWDDINRSQAKSWKEYRRRQW